jgi:membrane associated rhomboid family serine protease
VFLPIGDYPNPQRTQWVTRTIIGLNVAVYLFLTLPLGRPLDAASWRDPAVQRQVRELWQVQAPHYGHDPRGPPPASWLQELTKYDLVVDAYGYKPGKPSLLSLFLCMFLHADFLHVAGNMLYLWIFGDNVEARLGRVGYILGYLVTGVTATLAYSLAASGSLTPLVGASGAISGVLGFYAVWFPHNRIRVAILLFFYFLFVHIRAIWVLGVYLILDNLLPLLLERRVGGGGVAHGAHLGGFAAGLVGALLWNIIRGAVPAPRPGPYVQRRPAPWARHQHVEGATTDAFHAAVRMGRMEEAAHNFSRLVREGGAAPQAGDIFVLARWLYDNDFAADAAAVFRYYLSKHPRGEDSDRVHLGLGVLLARRLGQPVAAREHLHAAIDLARDTAVAEKAREELAQLG